MPLVITPRQLSYRAELYHQFSALTTAGIGLIQACEMIARNPPTRSFRHALELMLQHLNQGRSFVGAISQVPGWLPDFDIALLRAGEQSGRLDACFALLSQYYEQRAKLTRDLIGDLAYPFFVVHFAIFITPFPQLFITGNVAAYLQGTFGLLVPIYAVIFLLVLACQGRHGETWRSFVEQVGRFIPFLGKARRELAIARLSAALEALINAGVTIIEAWQLAAAASGSPAIKRRVEGWVPRLQTGQLPSEAVRQSREFPDVFASLYATGEISGKLDETLKRLHVLYQENSARKLRALAQWLPRIVYLIICLVIASQIIGFYTSYYNGIVDKVGF